jgi:hypothetical protein
MTLLDHPEDTILGKTPLVDCSLPHRHHYLTNNNHTRETYMFPAGFEVAFLAVRPLGSALNNHTTLYNLNLYSSRDAEFNYETIQLRNNNDE